MNGKGIHIILLVLCMLQASLAWTQANTEYKIEGREVILTIRGVMNEAKRDSFLISLGFDADCIDQVEAGARSNQGWVLESLSDDASVLIKSLSDVGKVQKGKGVVQFLNDNNPVQHQGWSLSHFGYNPAPLPHIIDLNYDTTRFILPGFNEAMEVYVSGNFVDWSTLAYPMKRTPDGWSVDIPLQPGVWGYKFIVDGEWLTDPNNKDRYGDGYGHINSRYTKSNHTFRLAGHLDERNVFIAGSFNGWSDTDAKLRKTNVGWELPVYIEEGTWFYKYVLGGRNWILDPQNPYQQDDGGGNLNSVLALGKTISFELVGHAQAQKVVLSGSFNGWNEHQLQMTRSDKGWQLPYVLGPGNYEYKFIVDGKWLLDPENPITVGEGDYENSVRVVGANTRFEHKPETVAQEVRLSGNFNGWAEKGYTMVKEGETWYINLFLFPGKYQYKFVVDGKWITDPTNAQKERNTFDEYNSVIWVK